MAITKIDITNNIAKIDRKKYKFFGTHCSALVPVVSDNSKLPNQLTFLHISFHLINLKHSEK